MIVEAYRPYIEQLLHNEPWRAEEGEGAPCPGAINWDGSRFWHCTACGKVGTCTSQVHASAPNPRRVLIPFAVGLARAVSRPSPLACAPHGALLFSPWIRPWTPTTSGASCTTSPSQHGRQTHSSSVPRMPQSCPPLARAASPPETRTPRRGLEPRGAECTRLQLRSGVARSTYRQGEARESNPDMRGPA